VYADLTPDTTWEVERGCSLDAMKSISS